MNRVDFSSKDYLFRFLLKLKLLLASRQAGVLIFAVAIVSRLIQLIFFYNIRSDASYQFIATDNFIHGYGISESWVNPDDLSKTVYQPLTKWPPGFSILIAPLYLLFDENYIIAGLVLDSIMAIALLLTCRAILSLLKIERLWLNLFTVVNGIFIYYFYFVSSSDDLAVSFMMVAVYLLLRLIIGKGSYLVNALLLFIFLLVAASIKYLFIPVIFIIPLFLVFQGYAKGDKRLKKTGIFLLVGVASLVCLFFLYQFQAKGTAGHVSSTGRGFFPEHLLQFYPFITSAFISPELLTLFFPSSQNVGHLLYRLLQIVNIVLIVLLLVYVFRFFKLKKKLNERSSFYLLSFFLSATVVGVLVGLSLFVSPEINFGSIFWTYVKEARYYGLVYILLQIAFFVFLQYDFKTQSQLLKASTVLLGLLLLTEVFRGFYFDINRIRHYGKEQYSWQYEERFQKYADTVIKQAKASYPNTKVIIAGPSYYLNHRITLYSHVPTLYKPEILENSSKIKTTQPVVAITYRNSEQHSMGQTFGHAEILAGKFEDFYFYILHVNPR